MDAPAFSPLCRVDPGLETDPVALSLADLARRLSPNARVHITTSAAAGDLPVDAQLSAQSKLARLGVESPTAFQWVVRNEKAVDWNRVRTPEELMAAAAARFSERAKEENYVIRLAADSGAAQTEVNALRQMAANDPQAADALRRFEAAPAQRWGELLGHVNNQRVQNVREWRAYLTEGNEEYAKDPFWQDCAWDIVDGALTSDRNRGLGTTVHLNQGTLAELRQSINGKTQPVALAANYAKLQAEHARASAADSVTTESARQWVYIPSKTEDGVNFQANVQKLKDLSCSSWCTKTYNAEPYLSQGGFWLLTEGSKSVCAIRLVGDRIQEIQGVQNNSEIPPEAGPDIDDLLAARPELKNVNLWRAENPGTPPEVVRQLAADDDVQVRLRIADRKDLDTETCRRLTHDPSEVVRTAVARNPNLSEEGQLRIVELGDLNACGMLAANKGAGAAALEILCKAEHPAVRFAVAGNPNSPQTAIDVLAKGSDERIQLRVVKRSDLTDGQVTALAGSQSATVRAAVAHRQAVPEAVLLALAGDSAVEVQANLLNCHSHRLTPALVLKLAGSAFPETRKTLAGLSSIHKFPEVVARLAADPKHHVRLNLAKARSLSDEALLTLGKDRAAAVRFAVAARPDAPEAALDLLAKSAEQRTRLAVARNPACGAAALLVLSRDESLSVRNAVAQHRNTAPETLATLAGDEPELVRGAVAQHPNTAPETLATLAGDEDWFVRGAVAQHRNTAPETLAVLAKDRNMDVWRAVLERTNLPSELLAVLAKDENSYVRVTVARHHDTAPETLAGLAKDANWHIRRAVAGNEATPIEALEGLSRDFECAVREAAQFTLVVLPGTPQATFGELARGAARNGELELLTRAMQQPSVPGGLLSDMSRHVSREVRIAVANNPSTPSEAVAGLMEDENPQVRKGAAANPRLQPEQLAVLAGSPDSWLRMGVGMNPNVTPDLLRRLARDEEETVASLVARRSPPAVQFAMLDDEAVSEPVRNAAAKALAANPKTEAAVLERVWDLGYVHHQSSFAANPNCPPKVLELLATLTAWDNRAICAAIAQNEATPKEVLRWLATDPDETVQIRAIQNPNWNKPTPVKETAPVPAAAAAPVQAAVVNPDPTPAVEAPAPAPEKPKELVFDKKRKDQLVFAFSMNGQGVEAYYDPATDTSVFLVDRIGTVKRGEELFFHETTHRNLTQFAKTPEGLAELGVVLRSAEPQLMRELPALLKATGHRSLAHLKQDYGFGDTEAGKTAVLGELMARHAEKLAEVEPPKWWRTLVNKVEVWFAKHAGMELSEGALTTWLARLPARLPNPEAPGTLRAAAAKDPAKLFSVRAGGSPVTEGRTPIMNHQAKGKGGPALDADQLVTDKIIEALDQGVIPWRKPWRGHDMLPKNLLTGQEYTGANIWLLMAAGHDNPWWVTFNQARELGGNVRKGEHGRQIVRWIPRDHDPKPKDGEAVEGKPEDKRPSFFPKVYTVFNASQCDGLSVPTISTREFDPILAAEQIVENYADKPPIEHGYNRAAYNPAEDRIIMPNPNAFDSAEYYYGTLFHELTHSSGAPHRLNRNLEGRFGTEQYAKEEFVAELGAAVLSARCGISTEKTEEDSVAYCQNWKTRLRADKALFRTLSKAAIEAARYISSDKAAPEPEAAPSLVPELEPAAPSFSVPDRMSARALGRLLGVEPTFKAIRARLGERDAFAGLHPDQVARVVNGYERLRLATLVERQSCGNFVTGEPRVALVPSRDMDPARIVKHTEALLGRSLTPAEAGDVGAFLRDRPKVREAVEASLGFNYVWRPAVPTAAAPDALQSAVGRVLDLDAGRLSPKEVARIFGPETVAPETWAAIRSLRPVEPQPAGEVYDAMVAAVGPEKVHEALVRAGYDGLTSTERPMEARRFWGTVQPAGLGTDTTARRWEPFAIDAAGARKVLPLTEEAVDRGVTLTALGVRPYLADRTMEGLRKTMPEVQFELVANPEQLLPFYPKHLHDNLMAAEAFYDPALQRVRVIASNVEVRAGESSEQAVTRVCLHEAVVHHGVRAALGKQADAVFTRIRAQAAAGFDGHATGKWETPERAAFKAVTKSDAYKQLSKARQGEEILARLQETAEPKQLGAWQRGVAACRLALGAAAPGLKLSVNDVDYLLWRGRAESERGQVWSDSRKLRAYTQTRDTWVLGRLLDEHLRTHPDGPGLSFEEGKALYRKHGAALNGAWEEAHPTPAALKAKPAGAWPDAETWEQARLKPQPPKAEPSSPYAGIPMEAIRHLTPEVAKRWEAMLKAEDLRVQPKPPVQPAPQNSQAHHEFLMGLSGDTRKQTVAELSRTPDHAKEWAERPLPKFAPPKLPNAEPLPEPERYVSEDCEAEAAAWRPELAVARGGLEL